MRCAEKCSPGARTNNPEVPSLAERGRMAKEPAAFFGLSPAGPAGRRFRTSGVKDTLCIEVRAVAGAAGRPEVFGL